MGSINKHIIVGTVGKDPVLRTTQGGKTVCEISVATNDGDKDAQGKEIANWHKVICFGKTADFVGKYVAKGTLIYCEGACKLRSFDGKTGKVFMKETICYKVEALSKGVRNENPPKYTPNNQPPATANQIESMGDIVGDAMPAPQGEGDVAGMEHTEQAPPHTAEDLPF